MNHDFLPKGEMVGYVSENEAMFMIHPLLQHIRREANHLGTPFHLSETGFKKRLAEARLIVTEPKNYMPKRKTPQGRIRYLVFNRSTLVPDEDD